MCEPLTYFLFYFFPSPTFSLKREEELEWFQQAEVLYYSLERSNAAAPQLKHNPWSLKCHQQHLQRMKENAKHRNQYSILQLLKTAGQCCVVLSVKPYCVGGMLRLLWRFWKVVKNDFCIPLYGVNTFLNGLKQFVCTVTSWLVSEMLCYKSHSIFVQLVFLNPAPS